MGRKLLCLVGGLMVAAWSGQAMSEDNARPKDTGPPPPAAHADDNAVADPSFNPRSAENRRKGRHREADRDGDRMSEAGQRWADRDGEPRGGRRDGPDWPRFDGKSPRGGDDFGPPPWRRGMPPRPEFARQDRGMRPEMRGPWADRDGEPRRGRHDGPDRPRFDGGSPRGGDGFGPPPWRRGMPPRPEFARQDRGMRPEMRGPWADHDGEPRRGRHDGPDRPRFDGGSPRGGDGFGPPPWRRGMPPRPEFAGQDRGVGPEMRGPWADRDGEPRRGHHDGPDRPRFDGESPRGGYGFGPPCVDDSEGRRPPSNDEDGNLERGPRGPRQDREGRPQPDERRARPPERDDR